MKQLFILTCIFLSLGLSAQNANNQCSNPTPFCTSSPMNFPAGTGSPNSQVGPNYGCLGSQPNPAWFYMQMAQSGPVTIVISAITDVDFICWGPFSTLAGNCNNLTAANTVPNQGPWNAPTSNGCSYSGSATETLIIPNAVAGQFYILLVTNYSNQPQNVNLTQTNANAAGAGATNCGVICGVQVSGIDTVCAGRSATLSVSTTTDVQSITWFGPNGYIGSNYNNQVIPNLQANTTVTVLANTNQGGSTGTCSVTHPINVIANPVPVVINNGPICAGQTASLAASGATNYVWSGPAGYLYTSSGALSNVALPNAQAANMGVYHVTLTAAHNCTATGSTNLIVKPNPTVTIGKNGDFCFGKSFNLLSAGAITYTWAGPNAFSFQGQNPLFTNNNFAMSGNYTVTGQTNGCKSATTISLTVFPLPTIIASTSGSVCQGQSVALTATGAVTYTWSGPLIPATHQSVVVLSSTTPTMSGTYSVVGKDINGCVNSNTVAQIVRPTPFVNIYSSDACLGKNINLSSDGGSTYAWTGPADFSSTSQNPVINNAASYNSGVYNVTVTSNYGCTQTASVLSNVYSNPDVKVSGAMEVCSGRSFHFSAQGAVNYKWLNSTGIVTQDPNFVISSISPQLQTSYTLVGTDGHFCSSGVPFYPVVYQNPVANIVPSIQRGCTPFCTDINLDVLSTSVTAVSWKLSDGSVSHDVAYGKKCITTAGVYTLNATLTDARTCSSVVTTTVEALVTPKADFTFTPDRPTINDNVVTFSDATHNTKVSDWTWHFATNESATLNDTVYKQTVTRTYADVGNYLVWYKVVATNGCVDGTQKVLVLAEDFAFYIPNAFTPNGDGLNDIFMPKMLAVTYYEMQVFTRWGLLLFSTNDPTKGWDGRMSSSGDVLPTDTYIYKCTVSDSDKSLKTYKGQFSLIK